jgi:pimeloyl-ACP methyl ester carboxylesterase
MKIPNKIFFLLLFFFSLSLHAQSDIDTTWSGSIDIMSTKLGIAVKFVTTGPNISATIDIPEQSAMGLPLDKVSFKNPKIYFELPAPNGTAVFEGLYYGDSIGGNFTQSGINGRFHLNRGALLIENIQQDSSERTFNSEEVTFFNDGNTFAGTITYPKGEGKFPAVVFITGSGAQNRDEEIYGFKIFRIIAEYLANNGIASLRYDDRGVGGSKGKTVNESTTMDFAGDVGAAVDLLKTKEYIQSSSIGLIGHSEGGIVAPITVTKRNDIAFIVLMAGTGVKGIDIIKEQSKLIMKAENANDDDITGYILIMDMIYDNLVKEGNIKDLEKQLTQNVEDSYDKMSVEEKKTIKNKDEYIQKTVDETIKQFSSKWMKYFLSYDPAKALEKVTIPVLMLFGGKDLQVPVNQNRKPMEDALIRAGNREYVVKVFPDANHLFQEAGTGSPNEYPQLPKTFVPGFLEEITQWIKEKNQ